MNNKETSSAETVDNVPITTVLHTHVTTFVEALRATGTHCSMPFGEFSVTEFSEQRATKRTIHKLLDYPETLKPIKKPALIRL